MDLSSAFVGLTDKQRIYVESRLQGMSQVASARAAGAGVNPDRSAEQYERNPMVAAAIERGRQISIAHTGYNREKIAEMLQRAYDCAESAAEMVMAARELGRLHGVYAPTNVKVDHNHRLTDARNSGNLKSLTTAELEKLAQLHGNEVIEGEFTEIEQLRLTDERENTS